MVIDLAFDAIMSPSCATAAVSVTTAVNGQRPAAAPGLTIRQGDPVALSYSVRNKGQTLLGAIQLIDNAGTANPADGSSRQQLRRHVLTSSQCQPCR